MHVLVVDDELIMREAYLTLFDWEKRGFHLAGVAHNALKAMEIIRTTQVDVVITDIKMPIMSGIDLIREVKKEFPDIQFVVMSGYDEYSLVREAFMLGVKDYFLKAEMDPEYVCNTLSKIKKEIEQKRNVLSENNIKQVELTNEEYRLSLKEKLIKELIWGGHLKKNLQKLNEYGIYFNQETMCIMVLSFVGYYDLERTIWNNEREVFKYAIINVLNEICEKYGNLYAVYNLPNEYLILFSKQDNTDFKSLFDNISDAVMRCFSLICNCGYSETNIRNNNFDSVYQEAKKACDFCFVTGNGSLINYYDIKYRGEEQNISSYIQQMKQMLSHNNGENFIGTVTKLRIQADGVSHKQVEEVKNLFYLYYLEMVRFIEENKIPQKECENVFRYDEIKDNADLAEFNKWITISFNELVQALSIGSKINRAKKYIRLHYSEALTLHTVAEHLGISDGHLSRLFQQSEGYGFSHFLLTTRMEKAQNLLSTTNLKIYEVAQQVGYTNTEQFSKMFKKVVGVTPKAFMK